MNQISKWLINLLQLFTSLLNENDQEYTPKTQVETKMPTKNNIKVKDDKLRNMNIKHFKLDEFDSPDEQGSGKNMDLAFLHKLDNCRELAGIPFKVNSGYRTERHNAAVGGVKNSPHKNIPCNAADIHVAGSTERFKILKAALEVGFVRIGVGRNFIHLDTDTIKNKKSQNIVWHYY